MYNDERGAWAGSVLRRSFRRYCARRYTQVLLEEYDDDRSYALRGNASQDAPRPLSNVAQMCAQAPALSTSCARLTESPVPFVTRSVTGGIPTRSDRHDQCRDGLAYNDERSAWGCRPRRSASALACHAERSVAAYRFSILNPSLGKCTCTTPARSSSRRRISSSVPANTSSPSTLSTP